ncbi:MAG: tetratricopeptide repeat protein [Calditrichaeota bacterium]|nr:tetratricopeptide repeat protein [Calditrichota bacterium]
MRGTISICKADLSSAKTGGSIVRVMKRFVRSHGVALLAVSLLCPVFSHSQTLNTGPGLPYVRAAWLDPPGRVRVHAHTRVFTKPSLRTGKGLPQTVVYWDIQGAIGVSYTTPYNVELTFTPHLYQDTHKGPTGFNVPDDIFLSAKFGTQKRQDQPFNFAVALDTRVPLGRYHNLILEPYSAGTFQWGLSGIASYRPFYNNLPSDQAFHISLGFTDYGDYGAKLTEAPPNVDKIRVRNTTRSIDLGFGASVKRGPISYWLQLFGSHFLVPPPVTAYSREDCFYLSPGLSYELMPGLSAEFALDIRLLGGADETDYSTPVRRISALPNYPGWRFNVGLRAQLPLGFELPNRPGRGKEGAPLADVIDELERLRDKLDRTKVEIADLRNQLKDLSERYYAQQMGEQGSSLVIPDGGRMDSKVRNDPLQNSALAYLPPSVRYLMVFSIGLANYRTGDYAKARIIFRDLIRLDPQNPYADNAAYWMGRTYENEGRIQDAIDAYIRASNLPDGDRRPYAWINIAACLFKLGRYGEGKTILKELVKRYPNYRMEPTVTGLLAKLEKIDFKKQ